MGIVAPAAETGEHENGCYLRMAGRGMQRALAHRVAMNVAALDGRYTPELELDLDPA